MRAASAPLCAHVSMPLAMPLTISLDPHANLTSAMVELADTVVPFRTYPHIDMKESGARAVSLPSKRHG